MVPINKIAPHGIHNSLKNVTNHSIKQKLIITPTALQTVKHITKLLAIEYLRNKNAKFIPQHQRNIKI